jgi:hypothetical protein
LDISSFFFFDSHSHSSHSIEIGLDCCRFVPQSTVSTTGSCLFPFTPAK